MKKPDDNKLDRLFREGLNKPDGNATFREEDWAAMEELLDQKPEKRDRSVWLYWLSGGIAAMLILFFGWALFNSVSIDKNQITKSTIQKSQKNKTDKPADQKYSVNTAVKEKIQLTKIPSNEPSIYSDKNRTGTKDQSIISKHATAIKMDIVSVNKAGINPMFNQNRTGKKAHTLMINEVSGQKQHQLLIEENALMQPQFYAGKRSIDTNVIELAGLEAQNNFSADSTSLTATPVAKNLIAANKTADQSKPKKVKQQMPPRFSLAILSAPDLNGVNSFTGTKVGTNAGLQLSLQLTRRFSINTGAVYASKPYEINMDQYQTAATYWGKPGEVAVNCKVLDIPVNLTYQVFSKNRNSFAAGAGLSSYFMMRENYNFYYTDNTSYNRSIVNQNKHILGVLNLNATYQRQVNSNFNLIVQPYLKLPLTPIGYEKISLQSAGVAIGVGWNISSFKNR